METSSDDLKKRAQDLHLEARRLCDTDSELSIKNAEECLQMARKYGFREEEILAKENLAYHLWHGGNIAKALELLNDCRVIRNEMMYFSYYDWCAKSIALIHWGRGNYDEAFQTVYDALTTLDGYQNEKDKCLCYWSLGVFFYDLKDYERSQEYYQKSVELSNEDSLLDNNITAYNLIGIGCCLKETGNTEHARGYFEKALEKSDQYDQWMQRARCLFELGSLHSEKKEFNQAKSFLEDSLQIRREHASLPGMISCLMGLGDIELRIKELERKFSSIQAEKEAEIQRLINVELKDANELISARNDEILSSVNYARMIQRAILPSENSLSEHLTDFFLIYLPKDIVAGDFYWLEIHQNKILFAVAD
ncbi:MAG: tetratricopeptide repeat protein, partial [Cryomorphaceae bacterium]|nr:tetratricopeptide repeat protein [Cryomorphaceae bacterium]